MANPVINSASFSKASHAPGETMLLTVDYTDPDNQQLTATITLTDTAGNSSPPTSAVTAIRDAVTQQVSSSPSRTWAKQSDNGNVAVFSAVA